MDTTRIDPIQDRLPSAGTIVSTIADITGNIAEQVGGHIDDLDVEDTLRRTGRTVSRVLPWKASALLPTSPRRPWWRAHPWLTAGLVVAAVTAVVALKRQRSAPAFERRDDWTTPAAERRVTTTGEPAGNGTDAEHRDDVVPTVDAIT